MKTANLIYRYYEFIIIYYFILDLQENSQLSSNFAEIDRESFICFEKNSKIIADDLKFGLELKKKQYTSERQSAVNPEWCEGKLELNWSRKASRATKTKTKTALLVRGRKEEYFTHYVAEDIAVPLHKSKDSIKKWFHDFGRIEWR